MIGIIAAMNSEYLILKKSGNRLFNGQDFKVVKSGIGTYAARKATIKLVDSGCKVIVGWGFAGGLSQNIRCGQVIIANNFVSNKMKFSLHPPLYEEFKQQIQPTNPIEGTIFASKKPIFTTKEKQNLAKNFNSIAVDMESDGIISVTKQREIPYFCIRVALDDSDTTLPDWISAFLHKKNLLEKIKLSSTCMFNPSESRKLIKLVRLYRKASKQLSLTSALLIR